MSDGRSPSGRATHERSQSTLSPPTVSVPNAAMDDASLQVFLNLTDKEAALFIPKLTTQRRATIERMASVVADLNMGVIPDGVIVCRPKCGGRHV